MDSFFSHLDSGESLEKIEGTIKNTIIGIFKCYQPNFTGDFSFIDFNLVSKDKAFLTINEERFVLILKNGKIKIEKDDSLITTLAKNIETLIEEALKIPYISLTLGLDGYTVAQNLSEKSVNYFFNQQNGK